MKVKTLSQHDASAAAVAARGDLARVRRNAAPAQHPLERAREYARAVVGAKLGRLFAAPFVGALAAHADGVTALAASPRCTTALVSGAADGEAAVWDLAARRALWSVVAHTGAVRGLAVARCGSLFLSAGDDRRVRLWRLAGGDGGGGGGGAAAAAVTSVGASAGAAADAAADDAADDIERSTGAGRDAVAGELRAYRRREARRERPAAGGGGGGGGDGEVPAPSRPRFGVSASGSAAAVVPAVATWHGGAGASSSFLSLDAHGSEDSFATSGTGGVDVWDLARSAPTQSFSWGEDSVTCVRWNPAERGLLASVGADRGVVLYDVRAGAALRKAVMAMRANSLAWNPREPFAFVVASEDTNVYTFDMRKLATATMVHKDHVGAVMDIAFSPTGREFVTGSYDRTVRLWEADAGKSRDVYHTKRMQRVFAVRYTADAKYVLSGSDDANVRLWKAQANASLARATPRERAARDYNAALIKRFAHMPDVRRIDAARRVPRGISKARAARTVESDKARRKATNVRAHAPRGSTAGVPEPERSRSIVAEVK